MRSFTDKKDQRAHVLLHFVDMWSQNYPQLRHLAARASKKTKAAVVKQPPQPLTWTCPDPSCNYASIPLQDWQLFNHLFQHHRFTKAPDRNSKLCLPTSAAWWQECLEELSQIHKPPQAVTAGLTDQLKKKAELAREGKPRGRVSRRVSMGKKTWTRRLRKMRMLRVKRVRMPRLSPIPSQTPSPDPSHQSTPWETQK